MLVSKVHKPTLRALAYAKLMRSDTLEALSISVDPAETKALREDWERRGINVPLKILDSPYREITRPVIDYVKGLRTENPRDAVSIYIPEYVVGRWYEHLLHNQSALRLKGRLLFTPGVMVTSVPYQLESSELAKKRQKKRAEWSAPGAVRRGPVDSGARQVRAGRAQQVKAPDRTRSEPHHDRPRRPVRWRSAGRHRRRLVGCCPAVFPSPPP